MSALEIIIAVAVVWVIGVFAAAYVIGRFNLSKNRYGEPDDEGAVPMALMWPFVLVIAAILLVAGGAIGFVEGLLEATFKAGQKRRPTPEKPSP